MSKGTLTDIGGGVGVIASLTLNANIGQDLNQWLTVAISLVTFSYMVVKLLNELRKRNE